MKKLIANLIAAAFATTLSASAYAVQGSNFAAHVSQAHEGLHLLQSGVDTVTDGNGATVTNSGNILHAAIHTANSKDLLIGVSLQSGLYTETTVKGKNGSSEQAGAEAAIKVTVNVSGYDNEGNPAKAYPHEVVFAGRIQELNAVLGGVITSCSDSNADGIITIVDECNVSDEEIGLILNTTSANHFNFVAPDLAPGDHNVTVSAEALSSAEFTNGTYTTTSLTETECTTQGGTYDAGTCTFTTTDNFAKAWAVVDIGTLTVQQVRAINQDGGINIDIQ